MGCPNVCSRVGASNGYILRAHMNKGTLLDNMMVGVGERERERELSYIRTEHLIRDIQI